MYLSLIPYLETLAISQCLLNKISKNSRPIPTYVLSSELQMLRDDLNAGGVDVILLDTWYKKDSNAVPPVSVLQPISSILVNFNNKVN